MARYGDFLAMQQLALQPTASQQWPNRMKALERDARDPNHATGGGFSLSSNSPTSIRTNTQGSFAGLDISKVTAAQATSSASSMPSIGGLLEPALNIIGGAVMGGPIGALTAAAGQVFEMVSGDSIIGHALGLFEGAAPAASTTIAQANRAYLNAGGLVKN